MRRREPGAVPGPLRRAWEAAVGWRRGWVAAATSRSAVDLGLGCSGRRLCRPTGCLCVEGGSNGGRPEQLAGAACIAGFQGGVSWGFHKNIQSLT